MCTKWTRVTLGLLIFIAAPLAHAGDGRATHQPTEHVKPTDKPSPADPSTKTLPATASDTAKANAFGVKGAAQKAATKPADPAGDKPAPADDKQAPADPSTKTLPASASDSAKANAFGQQGARAKAAHQAARAAAAQEAQKAADQGAPAPGARPNAAATTHASATGTTHGFDRATAGATNGQGATHSHR
ncbi:MAG TPA: hypothetical protein VFK02_17690 [Kofleriaceae bacterium]|nr:hypothetical protein [Kofleriaceae bacterium]